ncbi:MAG: adenine deaminase [Bacteroides sp.]|nr:adenine deaminase [Prevotella sp.]MCM1406886.1 adenine deaminase [Treponema brennaborense]MCM1470037.1 adenine deaminase [Bacteroides sp.]
MRSFEEFKKIRDVIAGREKADLLIKNARVVNVFTREVFSADVVVAAGYVCGFFDAEAQDVYDARGAYMVPGLIDAHTHIESLKVTADKLNDALLPRGVSMIIADPHEIANVLGTRGLDFMLAGSEGLDLDVIYNLPSCVPAAENEHSGAVLRAADLRPYYSRRQVRTLAEVMDYFSVLTNDDMLMKLYDAYCSSPVADGHGAILDGRGIDLYTALGIKNDHECVSAEQAMARMRRGMYVFIREGSVAKNLNALLPAVNEKTFRYMAFCTDDYDTHDLENGLCVTEIVRMAIKKGLDPLTAVCMASLNPAVCYGFTEKGAVAPGYHADFFLCASLETLQPERVYQHGKLAALNGKICEPKACRKPAAAGNSVNFKPFSRVELKLPLKSSRIHIMKVSAGNVLTQDIIGTADVENGFFRPSAENDQALLCVLERHAATGNIGKCVVTGFRMKRGAIATTVAHDSHNVICVGMNERDMEIAVNHLKEMRGGYCVADNGAVTGEVPLPVAGLLSTEDTHTVSAQLQSCMAAAELLCGGIDFNPFMMLSFVALTVIPEIKLSDSGLVEVSTGRIIALEADGV